MNNWTIAGRLGRDAETRSTAGGQQVTNFSVAVDEYAGAGERRTLWVSCAWWGDRGAKVAEYLTKGKAVTVSGQAGVRTFDGRNGTQAELTLNVRDVTLLSSGEGGERQQAPQQQRPAPTGQQRSAPARTEHHQRQAPPPDDDDIPF